jgi:hypothetical protein
VPERVTVERAGPAGEPVTVTLSIDVDAFASPMWRKILRDKTRPRFLAPNAGHRRAHGTLLGPAQVAAHMRGQVSAHELSLAASKHTTAAKIDKASTTVINAFSQLDVAGMWGDGKAVAADGSQIDTWENNLLAETSIRYGGYGGIAYRHISNTYIALFSHFIPCGVWEAVYIIEGLLRNDSDIQPGTIHADTQGQSLPVFGLAALLGFDLLPRPWRRAPRPGRLLGQSTYSEGAVFPRSFMPRPAVHDGPQDA